MVGEAVGVAVRVLVGLGGRGVSVGGRGVSVGGRASVKVAVCVGAPEAVPQPARKMASRMRWMQRVFSGMVLSIALRFPYLIRFQVL
jgi:hypothetical protein